MKKQFLITTTIAAIVASTAICGSTRVNADDGAMQSVSGVERLMKEHPSISMVQEAVYLNPATLQVRARFVFKNNGRATTVLMGFPEESGGDGDQAGRTLSKPLHNDMVSWVDGKPVRVTKFINPFEVTDGDATIWWTKKVHFDAGQTRIVLDRYVGGGGGTSDGNESFAYVLISGASWKGPIGKGVITLDLSGLPYSPIDMKPAGWVRHGNTAVLTFSNLKPKDDIDIGWYPAYVNVWINGASVFNDDGFMWQEDDWTPIRSRRRGSDVWLPAKAAAHWLGGKFKVLNEKKRVKIIYGNRWIVATVGSKTLATSGGSLTMPYPCTHEKPANGQDGSATMVALSTVVKALGGTYHYDSDKDKVVISIPKPQ